MRKSIWTSVLIGFTSIVSSQIQLSTAYSKGENEFSATPPMQTAMVTTTDVLHYFFNKHWYINTTVASANTLFYTVKSPANGLAHCGSVFLNTGTVTVTGLEGLVMKHPGSPSSAVPLRLYFFDMGNSTVPQLPATDSISTTISNSSSGVWVGGNFSTAHVVTGNFAVMFRYIGGNTGDTIRMFLNNAYDPSATASGVPKYGEGLSYTRFNGIMTSNTGLFGTGTAYEWVVAPRISHVFHADASVITPTLCQYGNGGIINTSVQMSVLENRQFNFNRFVTYWSPLNSALSFPVDSIYKWTIPGASPLLSYAKHPVATYTAAGTVSPSLTVSYWRSVNRGTSPGAVYDGTAVSIYANGSSAPQISVSGATNLCIGETTTLTASGPTNFTWTSPSSTQNSIVVNPFVTTVYTVAGSSGSCQARVQVTVNVSSPATVAITGPSQLCEGSVINLSASGAQSYTWSNGSHATSLSQVASTPGVESFTLEGTNGACPVSYAVKAITIDAKPVVSISATRTLICTKSTGGKNIVLTGSPSGGVYYGSNVTTNTYVVPANTATNTISYSYTNTTTQCANSATLVMKVNDCTGLGEVIASNVQLYPNPAANGKFGITGVGAYHLIVITNLLGEKVYEQPITSDEINLQLTGLAQGQYFVSLFSEKLPVHTIRIVNLN